jgi:hypothetical protein
MNSKSLSARIPDKYAPTKRLRVNVAPEILLRGHEVAVNILAKIQTAYHFLWFWDGPFRLFSNVRWCLGGRITPV